MTLAPWLGLPLGFLADQTFSNHPIVNPQDFHDFFHEGDVVAGGRAAGQFLGWGAQTSISPLNTLNSALNNDNQGSVTKGLRDSFLDIKNPSTAETKWRDNQYRVQTKETKRRDKKQDNLFDKLRGGLQ